MYESNNNYEPNVSYNRVPVQNEGTGFAMVSLALGLVAFFGLLMGLAPITGTIAVLCGVSHLKRSTQKRTFAVIGIVLGLMGIVISLSIANIIMSSLLPAGEDEVYKLYEILEQYSV